MSSGGESTVAVFINWARTKIGQTAIRANGESFMERLRSEKLQGQPEGYSFNGSDHSISKTIVKSELDLAPSGRRAERARNLAKSRRVDVLIAGVETGMIQDVAD